MRMLRAGLVTLALLLPVVPVHADTFATLETDLSASLNDCEVRATALVSLEADEPDPDALTEMLSGACSGIRPGATIRTPIGRCTMAFILTDGTDLYGTTAGHCGQVGDNVSLAPIGVRPDGTIGIGEATVEIGIFVFSQDRPIGYDFAVFRIHPHLHALVDPAMCGWGGPTGLDETPPGLTDPETVRHFGTGLGFDAVAPARARSGVLIYVNETAFAFEGAATPGDSGSPARLASGEALGIISDASGIRTPDTGPILVDDEVFLAGTVVGTRLADGLARARGATGLDLQLVTAETINEDITLVAQFSV